MLEALDEITPVHTNLMALGSPWLVAITSNSIALILDIDFS